MLYTSHSRQCHHMKCRLLKGPEQLDSPVELAERVAAALYFFDLQGCTRADGHDGPVVLPFL